MAIGTPSTLFVGSATDVATDRDFTVTLTTGAAVGERVIVFHGVDGGDTTPTVPAMEAFDSKGNTWQLVQAPLRNGVTGGTVMIMAFTSVLTTALVAGDTITIRSTNTDFGCTRRMTIVATATNMGTLDKQATYTGGSTSALSVGPTAATDSAPQIIWAWWGLGVRDFTPGTNYTLLATTSTTAGSTDRQLSVEYRIVSSTGAQTATATLASSTTNVGALATFRETAITESSLYIYDGTDWQPAERTLI